MNFTTEDSDNGRRSGSNCALLSGPNKPHGGWWYNSCWHINLNNYCNETNYATFLNRKWEPTVPPFQEIKIRPHNCNI